MKFVTDLLLLAGAAVVTYGTWSIHPSAGAIVGGVLLMTGGLLRGRAESLAQYTARRGDS